MTRPQPAGGRPASSPWPLGRIIGGTVLFMTLFSLAAIVTGALALAHLDYQRQRIETTIDPAALAAQQLYSALLNQETGVRGYALTASRPSSPPTPRAWRRRVPRPASSVRSCRSCPPPAPRTSRQTLSQAQDWRNRYAQPTIRQIQASGKPVVSPDILAGKAEFDALRGKLGQLPGTGLRRADSRRWLDWTRPRPSCTWPCSPSRSAWCVVVAGLGLRAARHRDPPGARARRRGPAGRRR